MTAVHPVFVHSANGLRKQVCVDGANCQNCDCSRAHANSVCDPLNVQHPKWCLRGWTVTCDHPTCPFNHFLTEAYFVKYRENDKNWATKNLELVEKHATSEPYCEKSTIFVEKNEIGNYYNGIWYPPHEIPKRSHKKNRKLKMKLQNTTFQEYFEVFEC